MYVGTTDARGLEGMLLELVGNSLDQHLAGHASFLHVEVDAQGWVTVEDDGRGIPVEPYRDGPPALEVIFTSLHSTPSFDDHHPHIHVRPGFAGVGVGVVSALSARLEVQTWRAGGEFKAAFERGQTVEPMRAVAQTARQGTRIRSFPDADIFGDARLELRGLERRLTELAWLCPRLDLRLQGKSLRREAGLAGWVRALSRSAVPASSLEGSGESDNVGVEFALAWKPRGKGPAFRSFVNFGETEQAGTHVRGLLDAVRSTAPSAEAAKHALDGLVGVVHVTLLHPRFQGPTRAALETEAARAGVAEIARRTLAAAPWWWDRLLELMVTHAPTSQSRRR